MNRLVAALAAVLALSACGPKTAPNPNPTSTPYVVPKASDFDLVFSVGRRLCPTPDTCSVEFIVSLARKSKTEFYPNRTFKVNYKVSGGKQPYANSIRVKGKQNEGNGIENIAVANANSKLSATLESVEEVK